MADYSDSSPISKAVHGGLLCDPRLCAVPCDHPDCTSCVLIKKRKKVLAAERKRGASTPGGGWVSSDPVKIRGHYCSCSARIQPGWKFCGTCGSHLCPACHHPDSSSASGREPGSSHDTGPDGQVWCRSCNYGQIVGPCP